MATRSQLRRQSPAGADALCDEELVRVAVAGGREAFETLVRRHRRSLVSHLYRQIGRRDAALDLAQEVFLKVYLSLGSFDPRYRFTTWLYRIATNCAIDLLRRKQPHTCPLQADVQGAEGEAPEREWVGAEPTPHEMLRLRELQERLEVAVSRLPAGYRRLILLRHRQHCRYDEIARITQLPIGTVKNRIFRARELLRRDLAEVLDAEV